MAGIPPTPPKRRGRRARTPTTTDWPTGPCRVCIYIRRSTDDEHQPFSLDAQRAALDKYVASQPGWTIVAEYQDDASGATTERPGLQKALQAAKARKGKWTGGTRPYGYLVQPNTHTLVPHPDEAPILREIFHLYTRDRLGTRAIAAELNHRGVPNRTGRTWSGHTINRILDNPAYVGDIAYRDVLVPDAHDPLIDRDTFRRARTSLSPAVTSSPSGRCPTRTTT